MQQLYHTVNILVTLPMVKQFWMKNPIYILLSTTSVMRVTDSMDCHTEHVDDTDGVEGNHLVVRHSMNHKAVLLYICHL